MRSITDVAGGYNRRIARLVRSGHLDSAFRVFDEMPERDTVSWNSLIAGCSRSGFPERAMELYRDMLSSGLKESARTFSSTLGGGFCGLLREGLQLHCRALFLGFHSDPFVGSALVDFYMQAGSPGLALGVLHSLPEWTMAACNSVLRGYVELGAVDELLGFFQETARRRNISSWEEEDLDQLPNGLSFSYLIRGCCCCGCPCLVDEGKQLHCHVIKAGWVPSNLFVSNALVDLYSASGDLDDARKSFNSITAVAVEDVISWNSMVSVCADNGCPLDAVGFFHKMLLCGKRPSIRSYVRLLNLSSRSAQLALGSQIHGFALKTGYSTSSVHVQSALIDMYGKCFHIEHAVSLFYEISDHEPAACLELCNSLITSFLHCNCLEDVLDMFCLMVDEGIRPDRVTFSATLKALSSSSSSSASANMVGCRMVQCCAIKAGLEANDEVVSCSLIDAYARSGHCSISRQLFDRIRSPNIVCFTAMITAYARNGMGREGMAMLDEIIQRGLEPDGVAFLSILAGCDHSGLVAEGRLVFENMKVVHGIEPDRRHYSCMVSLLGRAGLLDEALQLIEQASFSHSKEMWSSLLHSCRVHGNEKVGRRAAEVLMVLAPGSAATCLQISKFYYEVSDFKSWEQLRESMGMMMMMCSTRREKGRSCL